MKTETKILGSILVLTAVILVGGIFFLSGQSSSENKKKEEVLQIDYSKGQKIGSDSAKVRLVEFSDFQCPACQAVQPSVKQVLAKYPQNLQFIYRHFPLPQHTKARPAAIVAEAAGAQGKFWEMHDKLFDTQEEWSALDDATPFFLDLAKQLGLNEESIKTALSDNALAATVDNDLSEGRSLRINSTPTFFLNGRRLILRAANDLDNAVAEELKK